MVSISKPPVGHEQPDSRIMQLLGSPVFHFLSSILISSYAFCARFMSPNVAVLLQILP